MRPNQSKDSISTSIFQYYFFLDNISNPTVSTLYLFRPSYLASLSLCNYGHLDDSIPSNNHELFVIIDESWRSKPYGYWYAHTWSDITWILVGVFDVTDSKLFLFERCYFDSLNVSSIVDKFYLWFVYMLGVVVIEKELLGFNSEFILDLLSGDGFTIAESLVEMSRIFRETDLSVHSLGDFLVINLLLNV